MLNCGDFLSQDGNASEKAAGLIVDLHLKIKSKNSKVKRNKVLM